LDWLDALDWIIASSKSSKIGDHCYLKKLQQEANVPTVCVALLGDSDDVRCSSKIGHVV